jgi:hypothetical protein
LITVRSAVCWEICAQLFFSIQKLLHRRVSAKRIENLLGLTVRIVPHREAILLGFDWSSEPESCCREKEKC